MSQNPNKTNIKIKTEHLAERCEICHQADEFNPQTGVCYRCAGMVAGSVTALAGQPTIEIANTLQQSRFQKVDVNPGLFQELHFLEKKERLQVLVAGTVVVIIGMIVAILFLKSGIEEKDIYLAISAVLGFLIFSLLGAMLVKSRSGDNIILKYQHLFKMLNHQRPKDMFLTLKTIAEPNSVNPGGYANYTIELFESIRQSESHPEKPSYIYQFNLISFNILSYKDKITPVKVYFDPEPLGNTRCSKGAVIKTDLGYIPIMEDVWKIQY